MTKRVKLPPTRWQQIIDDAQTDDTGDVAGLLVLLADHHGMLSADLARFPELLSISKPKIRLRPEQISASVLARASRIEHDYTMDLAKRVKEWNAKYSPDPVEFESEGEMATPVVSPRFGRIKPKLFDVSIKYVIRWMGAEGWELDDVRKCLLAVQIELKDVTINDYIREGRRGDECAKLLAHQINYLYHLMAGKQENTNRKG